MNLAFERYGQLAGQDLSLTEISGRYPSSEVDQRRIILDVVSKLKIDPEDQLLDIGCGVGLMVIPLSFMVAEAVGIDHPSVISKVQRRFGGNRLAFLSGDFLNTEITGGPFSKVLCYSVLQCLASEEEVSLS